MKQASVASAVIETRMLTFEQHRLARQRPERHEFVAVLVVGQELVGRLVGGGDPVVDPLDPAPQLRLLEPELPLEAQGHAEEEHLQRVGVGEPLGLVGLLVELLAADVLAEEFPLQDVLPPLVGVRPRRIDQDLVDPVDQGVLGQAERGRGARARTAAFCSASANRPIRSARTASSAGARRARPPRRRSMM